MAGDLAFFEDGNPGFGGGGGDAGEFCDVVEWSGGGAMLGADGEEVAEGRDVACVDVAHDVAI